MSDDFAAIARHRVLRYSLSLLRSRAGLTVEQAAQALSWPKWKLLDVEAGVVAVSAEKVRALLGLYGVGGDAEWAHLIADATAARPAVWWPAYSSYVPHQFYRYLASEASAFKIHQLQTSLVPGLLQTDRYTQTLTYTGTQKPEAVARVVRIGAQRQSVLFTDAGPRMSFVVAESVLRARTGGHSVMREQLERIRDRAALPNVSVRVLPATSGEATDPNESFTVLDLSPDGSERILIREGLLADTVIMDAEVVADGYGQFEARSAQALDERETRKFVDALIGELGAAC